MAIIENISKREFNSAIWNRSSFDFSHKVLSEIIDYGLSNAGWAVEGQPGVLWVIIAISNIFIPCEVK